jgi:hypothetical protein
MNTATLREPMPLPQVEQNTCMACVTAQVRWMLGLSDLTGQAAVKEVKQLVQREADGRVTETFCLPLLLAEGCQVVRYGKPDPDMDRFEREGHAYFAEYYSDDWEAADETYWTPPRLAAWAERIRREMSAEADMLARYPQALVKAGEWFSLGAAERLLAGSYVIMTTYVPEDAEADMSHATLLYGTEDDGHGEIFHAYTPYYDDPGLMFFRREQYAGMLRPYADAILGPRG